MNKTDVKKWCKMIFGRNVLYVHQPIGQFFSCEEVKGYYNDLRNKIYKDRTAPGDLPIDENTGLPTKFPIQIFNFALGTFDCFLETREDKYLLSFWKCVEFAEQSMDQLGGWPSFPNFGFPNPYSSMAQGEGISVLCRAYSLSHDQKYLSLAKKAYAFLITRTSGKDNDGNDIYYEFAGQSIVFNGMVYSVFGIFDLYLSTRDEKIKDKWDDSLASLSNIIKKFDLKYWCLYSLSRDVCSKHYLEVHVSLCQALYILSKNPIFDYYGKKWQKEINNPFIRWFYFWKKAFQKIKRK